MKRLSLAIAALALTSGLAMAQDNTSPRSGATSPRSGGTSNDTTVGDRTTSDPNMSDRDAQRGAVKTTEVDGMQTNEQAANPNDPEAGKGTGVATGFVAAGIGLALLGLFVRRRNRRYGHYRDDDTRRGDGFPPRV